MRLMSICLIAFNMGFPAPMTTCVTVAKSGTHLIEKCIKSIRETDSAKALDRKIPCQFWHYWRLVTNNHVPLRHALQRPGPGNRLIIHTRDPRDILLSYANYIDKEPIWYPWQPGGSHGFGNAKTTGAFRTALASSWDDADLETRLHLLIEGGWPVPIGWFKTEIKFLSFFYTEYHHKQNPYVLFTRFEDLVGPNGGGSYKKQWQAVKKIALFLGVELTNDEISRVADNLYGNTPTFNIGNKGQVGRWKEKFSPALKEAFKENYQPDLVALGYANDSNW